MRQRGSLPATYIFDFPALSHIARFLRRILANMLYNWSYQYEDEKAEKQAEYYS